MDVFCNAMKQQNFRLSKMKAFADNKSTTIQTTE